MLKHIFAQPENVCGIDIYPVRLIDYDKFIECSKFLYISKKNFNTTSYSLYELLFMTHDQLGMTMQTLIANMEKTFQIVTRRDVVFTHTTGFKVDGKTIIASNYEEIRRIIMIQNLMFEPKVYKNPLVQEWANKVITCKQKNGTKVTMEDMVTTVKSYQGLTYDQLQNETIYQLYADFYRVCMIMQFEQASLFATVSSEKMNIQYFAENIDLFKNPYDSLFVSSDKLSKFNAL